MVRVRAEIILLARVDGPRPRGARPGPARHRHFPPPGGAVLCASVISSLRVHRAAPSPHRQLRSRPHLYPRVHRHPAGPMPVSRPSSPDRSPQAPVPRRVHRDQRSPRRPPGRRAALIGRGQVGYGQVAGGGGYCLHRHLLGESAAVSSSCVRPVLQPALLPTSFVDNGPNSTRSHLTLQHQPRTVRQLHLRADSITLPFSSGSYTFHRHPTRHP